MKHYRIFFVGYGGSLYDAGKNEVIPYSLNYQSENTAFYDLENWAEQGKLRKDLMFVVLPVFTAE